MKRLLLIILCFLITVPSYAAFQGNGTSQYVTLADSSLANLPDGDWAISCWIKITSNAGTDSQMIYEIWAGGTPYLDTFIYEDSYATTGNRGDMKLDTSDNDGTAFNFISTGTAPFTSNTSWTNIIFQRSSGASGVVTQYVNNSANGTTTNGSYDAVTSTGRVTAFFTLTDNSGNFLNGALANCAKWDRALSADERATLQKYVPECVINEVKWNVPMLRNYQETANGLTVTNASTTIVDSPRLLQCQ